MVSDAERAELLKEFDRCFHYLQLMRVWVDDDSPRVNVKCHSITLKVRKNIPIPMGLVMGNFNCSKSELTSLENSPQVVTGNFDCHGNYLETLEGGPDSVGSASIGGGTYSCSGNFLKNFEGAPATFNGYLVGVSQLGTGLDSVDGLPLNARLIDITYQKNLPLLKLLQHHRVNVRTAITGERMDLLSDILDKYAGQGQSAALACAAELASAGYKANAQW